ncbi:uncharacterized protein N7496_008475 [Penicillium cataractarum]|uniref:Uncharacterized protein n=1 Tax=Penicillium cataractarum TaxID=2100454 RepID=A0A9W9RZR7_9EURO|nr:uncharacterized protein N7496_008475 [Penicillium cataractarum]KAJ5368715.1 hypothetical protein N7496_008475 [Penicillium cataractarum]
MYSPHWPDRTDSVKDAGIGFLVPAAHVALVTPCARVFRAIRCLERALRQCVVQTPKKVEEQANKENCTTASPLLAQGSKVGTGPESMWIRILASGRLPNWD